MTFLASRTIRTRLTLWYVAVLACILAIYILVVILFQYGLLQRQMFHDEVEDVETVEGLLYFDSQGHLDLQQSYHSQPRSHLLVDRLMEVRDLSGAVLFRSDTLNGLSLGGPSFAHEGDNSFNQRDITLGDGTRVLLISHRHPIEGRPVLIRLAYSLNPLRHRLFQFLMLLMVAMPVALVIAGFAGYGIARRAFAPLALMAARAEQITASNLHDRVEVENEHDELGHMARVLNHLLLRLDQAFSQLRRFTADAAHELRTPLASLRATGEIALQENQTAEQYRDTLSSMLEETARLNQTIDGLLLLSKTEAAHPGAQANAHPPLLLPQLVDEVVTLLEVVTDERGITVMQEHDAAGRVPVSADRSLVRVAILNVLHNAVKFSPDGSIIRVNYSRVVEPAFEAERVCITDAGPGIAPGDYDRVFERFYTSKSAATSAHSGTGLGLSIAKLAVERTGGRIFFDARSSGGARCCIDLPVTGKIPPADPVPHPSSRA